MMLMNCSRCQTPLQLPPAATSIRCVYCHTITNVLDPRYDNRNESASHNGYGHDNPYISAPPHGYGHDNPYVSAPPPGGYGYENRYGSAPPPNAYGYGYGYGYENHIGSATPSVYGYENRSVPAPPAPPPFGSNYGFAPPPPQTSAASRLPSPYLPPGGPPPSPHGSKKAVICGIAYKSSMNELKGCINDAKCMKHLLIHKFHFPEASIIMLTDEEHDPYKIPTKQNIQRALFWLVQGCQPGDSLLFHFSGHGSRQRNYSGDEVDGYDEAICPLDSETEGLIIDDEINDTIVKPLPHGVRLHAIIDACHSGTVLDLPFLCRMNRSGEYEWEDHRPPSGIWKGTNGGEVISFSGCDDHQTSADTQELAKVTSTGVMTFCFIQAIERGHGGTYGSILNSMRSTISNVGVPTDVGGMVTELIAMLLTGESISTGFTQEPQLTASEPFDVYHKPFVL